MKLEQGSSFLENAILLPCENLQSLSITPVKLALGTPALESKLSVGSRYMYHSNLLLTL